MGEKDSRRTHGLQHTAYSDSSLQFHLAVLSVVVCVVLISTVRLSQRERQWCRKPIWMESAGNWWSQMLTCALLTIVEPSAARFVGKHSKRCVCACRRLQCLVLRSVTFPVSTKWDRFIIFASLNRDILVIRFLAFFLSSFILSFSLSSFILPTHPTTRLLLLLLLFFNSSFCSSLPTLSSVSRLAYC